MQEQKQKNSERNLSYQKGFNAKDLHIDLHSKTHFKATASVFIQKSIDAQTTPGASSPAPGPTLLAAAAAADALQKVPMREGLQLDDVP